MQRHYVVGPPGHQPGDGQFMVPSPNGVGWAPISESLHIQGCRDFERCARACTEFQYCPYNGGGEVHDDFMKGRTLKILLVQHGTWIHGNVSHWEEYIMGPADSALKWTMVVDLEAASALSVGAIVRSKADDDNENNQKLAVVTSIQPNEGTCHLATANSTGSTKVEMADWEPCGATQISFAVHRINVQGGGIVSCSRKQAQLPTCFDLPMDFLSLEWTQSFDDISYHLPMPLAWQLLPLSTEEMDDMVERKSAMLEQLRSEMAQASTAGEKLQACGQVYGPGLLNNLNNAKALQRELLCVPFVAYGAVLRNMIKSGDLQDLESAKTILALALQQAEDQKEGAHEFYFVTDMLGQFFHVPPLASTDETTQQLFSLSLYTILAAMGEWFEMKQEEFRTAIWCYQKSLQVAELAPFALGGATQYASLKCTDTMNIGVAYRKMGDFCSAATYYEKVFALPNENPSLKGNARIMQEAALDWIGTSGYLTPWETSRLEQERLGDCSSCGQANVHNKCGKCHLVYYCNADCQKSHWRTAHKHTCLLRKV